MPEKDAVDWYDANADQYADTRVGIPLIESVVWPGVQSLLPTLTDKRVLDAGCGDGTYTARLAQQGAEVIGVDASKELLKIARAEYGDEIEFHHADLRDPLEFLIDGSIDVIVSQLALDHIEDWQPIFEEFFRVLTPGGSIVLAVNNPPAVYGKIEFDPDAEEQFELASPSYFEIEPWSELWSTSDGENQSVQKYRRPLTAQVNTAFETGFIMDGLVEPTPTEAYTQGDPHQSYESLIQRPPTFICYRFQKPESA
jgi:SAM-dependent methyltransferase